MFRKKYEWVFHVAACTLFLPIPFFSTPEHNSNRVFSISDFVIRDLVQYMLLVAFFYLTYMVLIPRLYFTKKYIYFSIVILTGMWLIAFIPHVLFNNFPEVRMPMPPPPHAGEMHHDKRNFFFARINHNLFLFLAIALLALLLRIRNRWLQTEKEKLNAELLYLKAQINPHFLFNTLNSIYSLAIQKADTTPEAVQKLSSMMRYILTEANNNFVPLEKEIDYIKNYIDLQKLRFGSEVKLNYSIWGNPSNKSIAPLILISFIENAFKYGMNAAEDTNIKIVINMYEKRVEMLVINNKVTVAVSEESRNGIGIENTRSRLELLYPYAHELVITEDEKQFTVKLNIELA